MSNPKKPWYKTFWGILVLIFFWPYILIYWLFKNRDNTSKKWYKKDLAVYGISLLTLIIVLPVTYAALTTRPTPKQEPSAETTKPTDKPKEAAKEDTSDLDLTVKIYTLSLEVTNNEDKPLTNCEVRINPGYINDGYTVNVSLPAKTPVDINYSRFTKKSERFDNNKYAVEKVVVTRCDGQASRMGIYGS